MNEDKLNEFLGKFVTDLGATVAAGNVVIGHRLGSGYDLATTFDCLHDMGDPLGAARHIPHALKPDGNWLVVEPYAADEPGRRGRERRPSGRRDGASRDGFR